MSVAIIGRDELIHLSDIDLRTQTCNQHTDVCRLPYNVVEHDGIGCDLQAINVCCEWISPIDIRHTIVVCCIHSMVTIGI